MISVNFSDLKGWRCTGLAVGAKVENTASITCDRLTFDGWRVKVADIGVAKVRDAAVAVIGRHKLNCSYRPQVEVVVVMSTHA